MYVIAGYVVGGEWSIEEQDKLCKAIQEYCGDWQGPVGMLPSTVTWDMISEKVGSRSAIQCRQKWLEKYYFNNNYLIGYRVLMLSWKQQGGEEHWSSADDLRLIEELSKDEETEDEEEVDWEGLAIGWERLVVHSLMLITDLHLVHDLSITYEGNGGY